MRSALMERNGPKKSANALKMTPKTPKKSARAIEVTPKEFPEATSATYLARFLKNHSRGGEFSREFRGALGTEANRSRHMAPAAEGNPSIRLRLS